MLRTISIATASGASLAHAQTTMSLPGFQFGTAFGDNMVLQQQPQKSAVYGYAPPSCTSVSLTVSSNGAYSDDAYTIKATMNTTHQPYGPDWGVLPCSKQNCPPYDMTSFTPWNEPVNTWKAILNPTAAGGNYTIQAECTAGCNSTEAPPINISNVAFGDVWYCSGQSNMWLPVDHSFSRNDTVAAIKTGKYSNVRAMFGGSGTTPERWTDSPTGAKLNDYNPWLTAEQAIATGSSASSGGSYPLFKLGATCWYFGQRLSELGVDVPIGLMDTAIGGQRIEEYMSNHTIGICSERAGAGVNGTEAPSGHWWDGRLFGQQVLPFVDMTVKGWVWYQGENNMGCVKCNSIENIGYSCEQRELIRGWRDVWSEVPGTTNPDAPFGVVTLASSGAEGHDNALGAMRIAQTAGYGILPNQDLPNTFFAQAYDLDDQWGPALGPCFDSTYECCDKNGGPYPHPPPGPSPPNTSQPPNCPAAPVYNDTDFHTGQDLGSKPGKDYHSCCSQCSTGDLLAKGCQYYTWVPASNGSPATCWFKRSNGGKRTIKGVISGGIRPNGPVPPPQPVKCTQDIASKCELACSAARDTPSAGGIHPRDKKPVGDRLGAAAFNTVYGGQEAATGPTLSGCAVDATSLTVSFNSSLLKGDTINLQKYGQTSLSFFEVQTDASSFCLEPQQNISADGKTRISYCPTWAGGNGSVATGSLDSGWISLDIKLGSQGQSIVADLSPLQGTLPTAVRYAWNVVNCCDPADPDLYVKYPCGPSSCPIMSKQTNLPANPFVAKIINNKCECVAPMQCSN